MIPESETFEGTWPFKPHYYDGHGFRQHYVDEPGEGPETIVCLHGEPTWGYLYRYFIPRLQKYGRVVVPDHMGFGKSETPRDRDYLISDHLDNLEALFDHLKLSDITLVGQDWGGPLAGGYALRHPERIKRFCFMNTAPPGVPTPEVMNMIQEYPWFKWVQTEEAQAVLSNLGGSILSVLKRIGFERTGHVDENWIRAYASSFLSPADCKGAIAFPKHIASPETLSTLTEHITNQPQLSAKPAMLIHGLEDRAIPFDFALALYRSTRPNGPVVTLPGVGHFIQEDAPETACALIEQFIQMTP